MIVHASTIKSTGACGVFDVDTRGVSLLGEASPGPVRSHQMKSGPNQIDLQGHRAPGDLRSGTEENWTRRYIAPTQLSPSFGFHEGTTGGPMGGSCPTSPRFLQGVFMLGLSLGRFSRAEPRCAVCVAVFFSCVWGEQCGCCSPYSSV